MSAEDTTKAFFKALISRHGCPEVLIIDDGTNFKAIFEIFCRTFNIQIENTAYVYRIRFIRVLEDSPLILLYGRVAIFPQDLALNLKQKYNEFANQEDYKIHLLSTLKE